MDEKLKRYIETLEKLRTKAPQDDAQAFRDVALELGLSASELASIEARAHEAERRARVHLASGQFAQAIPELETALSIEPWRVELQLGLAEALVMEPRAAARERADKLASDVLEQQPSLEAAHAIRRRVEQHRMQRRRRQKRVSAAFGVLAGVGVWAWMQAEMRPAPSPNSKIPIDTTTQSSSTSSQEQAPSVPSYTKGLPVEWVSPSDLQIHYAPPTADVSWRVHQDDKIIAHVQTYGLLTHLEGDTFRKLKLRVDVEDSDGGRFASTTKEVLSSLWLRPGDVAPVGVSELIELSSAPLKRPHKVKIEVVDVLRDQAPQLAAPLPLLAVNEPGGRAFEVHARGVHETEYTAAWQLVLANVGTTDLSKVTLVAKFVDKNDKPLGNATVFWAGPLFPPIRKGERRVASTSRFFGRHDGVRLVLEEKR